MAYKQYFVYMMCNEWKNVLYVGVTNALDVRVAQHKQGTFAGFTKKYNCKRLVYFETYDEITQAIAREKQIKRWSRAKKDQLIAMTNPEWNDLAAEWADVSSRPSEASGGTPFLRSDDSTDAGDPSTQHPNDPHVSSRPSEASGGTPFLRSGDRADAGDPSTSLGMTRTSRTE